MILASDNQLGGGAGSGMNTYQLLDLIRRKPAMYMGKASVQNLRVFLAGYEFGISQAGVSVLKEMPDFAGFHDWVASKLGYGESTSGWNNMIANQRVDSQESMHLFFQLLDDYRGFRPRMLADAVLDPESPLTTGYFIDPTGWKNTGYIRPMPTSVVIEEVLPNRDWVSLTIRKNDNILGAQGFDDVQKAIAEAETSLSIPRQNWKVFPASA